MAKNLFSGALLLALSVGYYLTAAGMPTSILDTSVNSAAFPKLLGIAGAVFSVALMVQALFVRRRAPDLALAAGDKPEGDQGWQQHRRAAGLLAIICVFILALQIVGYPVAIALLILAVSAYQGYPLSRLSVAVAIAGGVLFWLFFMVFLGIRMPLGLWSLLATALSPPGAPS